MLVVVNPEGQALNLDAACRLAPLPPEIVDGPQRLLVVTSEGDHAVYDLTIGEILAAQRMGTSYLERRWVKGIPPQMPGRETKGG